MNEAFSGKTVAWLRDRARQDAALTAELYPAAQTTPVDPVLVAREMGIEVFSAQLGEDVYGMITSDGNGARIFVDEDNPRVRQRFTIAHEIGHYVANANSLERGVTYVERRSDHGSGSAEEIHANEFAASLLMPESAVKEQWAIDPSVFTLASAFDVSVDAARWRVKHLGLSTSR